jgi:hypothetical protein
MDQSSRDHVASVACLKIIRKHFTKPFVSPVTFIIANFILGKFAKSKSWHKKQMQLTFSGFHITPIGSNFIDKIFTTHFVDLEDGLQYQCAANSKADLIITKDLSDYFDSKIPVAHPHDFVSRYHELYK